VYPFGRAQADVAEHLLDEADVRPAVQHQRRHRVTEEMGGAFLSDLRFLPVLVRDVADVFEFDALARVGQEDRVIVGLGDEMRAGFVDVLHHACRLASTHPRFLSSKSYSQSDELVGSGHRVNRCRRPPRRTSTLSSSTAPACSLPAPHIQMGSSDSSDA
jgi:hypothetical protein